MRVLDETHPEANTSKHYFRPKLDENILKTENNKMKKEFGKTRSKQINLIFIKHSLDKI